MSAPTTRLDPAEALRASFAIYKNNFGVLFPAALAVYGVSFLAGLALTGSTVGALALSVISIVLSYIFTGSVVQLVRDVQDGQLDASVGQLISSVTPVLLPLLLASLLSGLIIGIGFVLIIVPGFIAMTFLLVVAPVVVIERPGVIASLKRSRELVSGHGWQAFGVVAYVFVLNIAVGIVAGVVGAPFGDVGGAIVQWIISAAVFPVVAIVYTVAYLRLRELKGEGPVGSDIGGAPIGGTAPAPPAPAAAPQPPADGGLPGVPGSAADGPSGIPGS